MSIWKVKPLAKLMQDSQEKEGGLKRSLSSGALIALGIGAIIGAGLFSLTGIAEITERFDSDGKWQGII